MLFVIGTGTGSWSAEADKLLKEGFFDKIVVKTALIPAYEAFAALGLPHECLDEEFEHSRTFDSLHRRLAERVRACFREYENVAYLVDGSGFDDESVVMLSQKSVRLRYLPAAPKFLRAGRPMTSCCVYACADLLARPRPEFPREIPLYVTEIDSALAASELKLRLTHAYGDQVPAFLYTDGRLDKLPLCEIDRAARYDFSSTLCLVPQPLIKRERFGLQEVLEILDVLRSPRGCPWDRAQTHESIRINAIEEAYEVADAVDSGEPDKLCEEIGDLLLQTCFHAAMSETEGTFDLSDVLTGLCKKLITRHTHIFDTKRKVYAPDPDKALAVWEANKRIEKHLENVTESMVSVPRTFPALLRAQKIRKKAEKAGLTMPAELPPFPDKKLRPEAREQAAGEFLFAASDLLRGLNVDAEVALAGANEAFIRRFELFERDCKTLFPEKEMSRIAWDDRSRLWEEAGRRAAAGETLEKILAEEARKAEEARQAELARQAEEAEKEEAGKKAGREKPEQAASDGQDVGTDDRAAGSGGKHPPKAGPSGEAGQ